MNSIVYRLTFVVFLLIASLDLGSCLRCYRCIEPHSRCRHSHPVKCNDKEVCGKSTTHGSHLPDVTVKDCVPKNFCKDLHLPNADVSCLTCRRELCNSSSIMIPAFAVLAVLLFNSHLL